MIISAVTCGLGNHFVYCLGRDDLLGHQAYNGKYVHHPGRQPISAKNQGWA